MLHHSVREDPGLSERASYKRLNTIHRLDITFPWSVWNRKSPGTESRLVVGCKGVREGEKSAC